MKFFEYFGVMGTLSLLAWIAALVMLARSRRDKRHRWRRLFIALALAAAAWQFGETTSNTLMRAKIDDREDVARSLAEQEQIAEQARLAEQEKEAGEKEITTRFAEDSPEDSPTGQAPAEDAKQSGAGVAEDAPDAAPTGEAPAEDAKQPGAGVAEDSPAGRPGDDDLATVEAAEQVPEYKRRGKQTRGEDKKERLDDLGVVEDDLPDVRYMLGDDLIAAKKLDHLNRFVIRLILWTCVGLIVWDYLRAFNATLTTRWLVPIGGRWLDSVSPKARLVLVPPDMATALSPRDYAGAAVRRGENVIYFGTHDPWPEAGRLVRLACRSWLVWALPKVVAGAPGVPDDREFLLDGAWFGWYAVVVPAAAPDVLARMIELLWQRHETGAVARRTVHLVWALPEPPGGDALAALRRLAGDTNVRLAVWTGAVCSPELREGAEEVRPVED